MFLPDSPAATLRVGIVRTSSIGDVVLATACIQLLLKLRRPVEIHWLGRNPSLNLIQKAYPQLKVVELSEGYKILKVLDKLKHIHFLIDLQTNIRSFVIGRAFKQKYGRPVYSCNKSFFFRGRLVIGSHISGRRKPLSDKALKSDIHQTQMMTKTVFRALFENLSADDMEQLQAYTARPVLPIDHELKRRHWQKELQFGAWLAVAPGASYEPKRAPIKIFSNIIQKVRSKYYKKLGEAAYPFGLILLGDGRDRKVCLELLESIGWNEPVLNLAGKLSLWEASLALGQVNILLSNDSGVTHMAEAVQTPAAVLFGPTVEGFGFSPQLIDSRAFSVALGCRPCSKHGKTRCRFMDQACFSQISSESVSDHVLKMLMIEGGQDIDGKTRQSKRKELSRESYISPIK